ncbi:hypothetical protein ACFL35_02280 [Candidatus Riflebacteria bacterium]
MRQTNFFSVIRKIKWLTAVILFLIFSAIQLFAKPELQFKGEIDFTFSHVLFHSELPDFKKNLRLVNTILDLDIKDIINKDTPFDAFVSYQLRALDSLSTNKSGIQIEPYRYWFRYFRENYELRLGMQKLVFGHARVLRPLALFDSIDPTDYTKKTSGQKAFRLKYFPRKNLELHGWTIHNDENSEKYHYGGRINRVFGNGEIAATFQHWNREQNTKVNEDIWGFDLFLDIEVGFWIEHASHLYENIKDLHLTTTGIDYTFPGIGNGLHVGIEHLLQSSGNRYKMESQTTSIFWDIPLTDETTFFGIYFYENSMQTQALNLRLMQDLSDNLNGALSINWVNKNLGELTTPGNLLPFQKDISIRLVYSF